MGKLTRDNPRMVCAICRPFFASLDRQETGLSRPRLRETSLEPAVKRADGCWTDKAITNEFNMERSARHVSNQGHPAFARNSCRLARRPVVGHACQLSLAEQVLV